MPAIPKFDKAMDAKTRMARMRHGKNVIAAKERLIALLTDLPPGIELSKADAKLLKLLQG